MIKSNVGTLPRATSNFAIAAILCFVYAVVVLLITHVLRPDVAPATSMISEYAVGPYGWVMATVFFVWGAGCLMLVLGLIRVGLRSGVAKVGTAFLALVSLCAVDAFFPTDLPEAPATRSGFIHGIVFLVAMVSFILATLLLVVGFGRDARWRSYRSTALTLTILNVAAIVLQFLTLHRGMHYGLVNRLVFAMMMVWFIATSIRLRAVAQDSSSS